MHSRWNSISALSPASRRTDSRVTFGLLLDRCGDLLCCLASVHLVTGPSDHVVDLGLEVCGSDTSFTSTPYGSAPAMRLVKISWNCGLVRTSRRTGKSSRLR
jgi:hypothetical protein